MMHDEMSASLVRNDEIITLLKQAGANVDVLPTPPPGDLHRRSFSASEPLLASQNHNFLSGTNATISSNIQT